MKKNGGQKSCGNLSAPKCESFNDAVNPLVLRKLVMSSVMIFAKLLLQAGDRALFAKQDMASAYKLVPTHPTFWRISGLKG
jgi:hypothetical protein